MDLDKLAKRVSKLETEQKETDNAILRAQGEQDALLKQLKEEFGLSSIDEAEEKLHKIQSDIDRRSERLGNKVIELENLVNG